MKDLKFEQKRSLTRDEAADLLAELAKAFREGGEAELELGTGVLSLRVPEEFRTEVEFEVGGGEIELEIELKWRTDGGRGASPAPGRKAGEPRAAADPEADATSGAAESDEETGGSAAPAAPSDTRSRKSTSPAQKRSPAKRSTAKRTPAKRTSAKRSSAKQP